MNHVIGDITLYKLGADPRFSIDFAHERLDGYNFRPAGSGFYHRNDALDGSLSFGNEGLYDVNGKASYAETEDGLQGLGSFNSVTHRFINGNFDGGYLKFAPFSVTGSVDGSIADLTLSGANPVSGSEYRVAPTVAMAIDTPNVSGGLSFYYGLTQGAPPATSGAVASQTQKAGGDLSIKASLPYSLTLSGSFGLHWDDFNGLQYPFGLSLGGVASDLLTYRVYGGYRVNDVTYLDLWNRYPYLDQSIALHSTLSWYLGGEAQLRFRKELTLDSSLEYSTDSGAVLPTSIDSTGLFGFNQIAYSAIRPAINLSWTPAGPFSLRAGWKGAFLNPNPFFPLSTFTLDAELSDSSNRYGGGLTGSLDLFSTGAQVPNIGLSGFFRASEGVLFLLELSDVLAPLIPGGRTTWSTYAEPGFDLVLRTEISL